MKVKPVDYDEFNTDYRHNAVCPYCGCENEVYPENYKGQDEEDESKCGECERTFIYTIDYDITFCSYPFENWAFEEISRINRVIATLKDDMKKAPETPNETTNLDKDWYKNVIKYKEEELDKLKKKVNEVLGLEEKE